MKISPGLSWLANTTAVIKKAMQYLHFLRLLKKENIDQKLLITFCRSSIEIVLTYCALEETAIKKEQKIMGCSLSSLKCN